MFCPPSHHYDITQDPEQEAIKDTAAVLRIHQWKIFIRVHILAEGKCLPLKGGDPLAAYEKLQNIK